MGFYTGFLALSFALAVWRICRRRARNPPGPSPLPIIGNVLDMPRSYPWETYMKWGEKYGDTIFVKNFSDRLIIINSHDKAVELLEKRGAIYSSRPRMVMCRELGGWEFIPVFMPYCERQRKLRQEILTYLQPSATKLFRPALAKEVHKTLLKIIEKPDQFYEHIRYLSGASTMAVAYGYDVKWEDDPYVILAKESSLAFTTLLDFFVVNHFPILKHLPNWFPGAGFKAFAKTRAKYAADTLNVPYAMSKELATNGQLLPSIISSMLGDSVDKHGNISDEERIKIIAATMYIGGADTTVSVNLSFILAMVLHPEIQRRGQEEIDKVVGKGNLPTYEDLDKLPYVTAMFYEVMRWHPPTPQSGAHTSTEDDVYNGYFIPAGTTIIANVWAMSRDPIEYPEPHLFKPERFLHCSNTVLPRRLDHIVFGFGRRVCPGRHLAESLTKFTMACCLAAFNFEKITGEDGLPITPPEDYTANVISRPKPFQCKITPRAVDLEALVNRLIDAES